MLDDGSAKKILIEAASLQKRDIVVMQVKGNLIKSERKTALNDLPYPPFKKVAAVVMGEPPNDFRQRMQTINLASKQEKIDAEHKVRVEARSLKRKAIAMQREADQKRQRLLEHAKRMQEERMRQLGLAKPDEAGAVGRIQAGLAKPEEAAEVAETDKKKDGANEDAMKK